MHEWNDTFESDEALDQPLCSHCFEPIDPQAHFCPHCSAPTGATSAIDPIARIWAAGYFFQQLRRQHPVLWFIAMLLYAPFVPAIALCVLMVRAGKYAWQRMQTRVSGV
jgi:predicted amidophosphoribosyltransferase